MLSLAEPGPMDARVAVLLADWLALSIMLPVTIKLADSVEMRCIRLGVCGRIPSIEIAAPAKPGTAHHWKLSKAHIETCMACYGDSFTFLICR
jgi:hypothetical protein